MIMLRLTSQIMSVILLVLLCAVTRLNSISCCHENDRSLLLKFKEGVIDPSNLLSSWSSHQQYCCHWNGVSCDDNNRVMAVNLQNEHQNRSASLRGEVNLSSLLQLEFLGELNLNYNDFERIISTPPIINHTHLLPNSSKLSYLSLSGNINLHFDNLHYWLSLLPSLEFLNLSGIHHLPSQTNWVQSLASLPTLIELGLSDCNLTSSVLSLQYANFSSLSSLDLCLNDFTYGLPDWLFNLSKNHLSYLYLSQCNLRGQIPDFSGFYNLRILSLSNNKLKGSIPDWLGQFQTLIYLDLSNNSFHGSIPLSLTNSSSALSYLYVSFNNLSEAHPKVLEHVYAVLDLSHNSISGDISKLLLHSKFTDLSSNKLQGPVPRISDRVVGLDLSHNSFSGSLSSLLCPDDTKYITDLRYLDVSNNFLTGGLPDCWSNWANLISIYMGSNKLSGEINPTMASSLLHLRILDLHGNNFYGHIPRTFENWTSLVLLNLEANNFSGTIPKWMPQHVSFLKLRSNQFIGDIPIELCSLSNLTLLDLANNTLSGTIPHCLDNLTFMVPGERYFFPPEEGFANMVSDKFQYSYRSGVHTKGLELVYHKHIELVRSIDLSRNNLSGKIPVQLFNFTILQSLNLSNNYLIGEIPEQIGEMKKLESLDFSHNNLHGNIPQSISGLSFLSYLNLSYNHFSGQIPLGTQLQSFEAWSYTGNLELCGAPLQKNCTIPKKPDNTEHVDGNEDDAFLKSLYLGMGVGFAMGFWVVCGSLFMNRVWRHTYFRFFNSVVDRIYVFMAINLRRVQ